MRETRVVFVCLLCGGRCCQVRVLLFVAAVLWKEYLYCVVIQYKNVHAIILQKFTGCTVTLELGARKGLAPQFLAGG